MTKKLLAGIVLLIALIAVTVKIELSSDKEADGVTVITVWESLNGPDKFIEAAGRAYEQDHPGIKIRFVNVESGASASQILLDGPAGVGPDLFAAPHDKLGELINEGVITPIEDEEEVANKVITSCKTALTYNGRMYGYPVCGETYALFYNKELISEEELPKDWNELIRWCKMFNSENKGKRGFVMSVGEGYYTIIFTTANGNRLFGPTGTDTTSTYLNTYDAVVGMKVFQNLREIYDVQADDINGGNCDSEFAAGKAAMYITGLWNVANFEERGIKFGVAPLPALPGTDTPSASFSGTRAMFVSEFSDHPKEAADFAKFLISPEMQKLRFDITKVMPSISVDVDSQYMEGFLKQLEYSFPMPSIPAMNSFWDVMNNASKNIWNGLDVENELNTANSTILGNIN